MLSRRFCRAGVARKYFIDTRRIAGMIVFSWTFASVAMYTPSTVVLCRWAPTVWAAVSPCRPRSLWRNAAKYLRQAVLCFCTPRCASSPGDRTLGQPLQAEHTLVETNCLHVPSPLQNIMCPWGGMSRSKRSFEVVQAYLHRFLRHYSDLIMATPELREASKALRDEQVSRSAVMSFYFTARPWE